MLRATIKTAITTSIMIAIVSITLVGPTLTASGQGDPDAWPTYRLNIRTGPDTSYATITKLDAGTGLILEARNTDSSWVLVHTLDGGTRGWAAALYLGFREGLWAGLLPVSDEILPAPAAPAAPVPADPAAVPADPGAYTPNASYAYPGVDGIDLTAYPVIATPTARAHTIYATGLARGNNPNVIAKVGDCGTDHPWFLVPFAFGAYSLGNYGYLQAVINHFGISLGYSSQAASGGFVVDAVIDPQWANPGFCNPGESALQCEYRIHRPSVALIMFGQNDLARRTPAQFYSDLRVLIDQSAAAGVLPILSTFPRYLSFPNESILFNQIVVRVALDTGVPLMNLWLALEPLPDHGMLGDGAHMSGYTVGGSGYLLDENLQFGYTMRNLVTLQSLDAIWRGVMGGG